MFFRFYLKVKYIIFAVGQWLHVQKSEIPLLPLLVCTVGYSLLYMTSIPHHQAAPHTEATSSHNSPNPTDDADTAPKDSVVLPAYSTEDKYEDDPWNLPELQNNGLKWSGEIDYGCFSNGTLFLTKCTSFPFHWGEHLGVLSENLCDYTNQNLVPHPVSSLSLETELDTKGKVMRVLTAIVKFILLVGFLYMFVCSLDVLSSAFQLVGGNIKPCPLSLCQSWQNEYYGFISYWIFVDARNPIQSYDII